MDPLTDPLTDLDELSPDEDERKANAALRGRTLGRTPARTPVDDYQIRTDALRLFNDDDDIVMASSQNAGSHMAFDQILDDSNGGVDLNGGDIQNEDQRDEGYKGTYFLLLCIDYINRYNRLSEPGSIAARKAGP